MNDLDEGEIALLAKLADGATLRSVATALGLPRSTVSERLQGLEEKLGQRVFVRQGRRLVPTRLGTILLERAVRLVRAQSEFLDAVHRARDIANDHLVVAVSPSFAEMLLGPLLVAYRARRPNTTIELRMTHDEEPLVDNGIDIAIRRGRPGNSTTLLRRRLGKTTLIVVGAPKWALANDESREALLDLPWIRVGSTIAPMEVPWSGRHIVVHPVVAADSQRLARELVLGGLGVARLNRFTVKEDMARGDLIELSAAVRTTADAVALFPADTRDRPVVRDFLELLVAHTRVHPLFEQESV